MATIKRHGRDNVILTEAEFAVMEEALVKMIKWDTVGMFGDGDTIIDKAGLKKALSAAKKLGY